MDLFSAIIIGAGQAGVPLAQAFAAAGKKTALVEAKYLGGTCINTGCTPTKTMVASAQAVDFARRAPDLGIHTGAVTIDQHRIRERKNEIVESFREGLDKRIESSGVELVRGTAKFTGPRTLEIALNDGGVRSIAADEIVIDTGGRPAIPRIEGISSVPFLDSTSVMDLAETPDHLVILGGGYAAVEFAQMFRRFGSQVTIVQKGDQLLSREDPDVAAEVTKILQEDGIRVVLKATAKRVETTGNRAVRLLIETAQGASVIEGSHLLTAIGREPNTGSLNLAAAGIRIDERGCIPVDERLQTNVAHVHATGDVNGGPAFTHISYDDYRILKTNLLENGRSTTRDRLVPYTVFIDPQLGRVGLTETQARQQGKSIQVAKITMDQVTRAIETGQTRGIQKAIVDCDTGQILGAAILGMEGGEVMAMIEIAMMGKLPYTALRDGIFTHPSLSESLNTLFASVK